MSLIQQKTLFLELLQDSLMASDFREYLASQYADECYDFWLETTLLETATPLSQVPDKIRSIYLTYIDQAAPRPVNLSGETILKIKKTMSGPNPMVYSKARKEILDLMFINHGFDFVIENEKLWSTTTRQKIWVSEDLENWQHFYFDINPTVRKLLCYISVKSEEDYVKFTVDLAQDYDVLEGVVLQDKYYTWNLTCVTFHFASDSPMNRSYWIEKLQNLQRIEIIVDGAIPRASSDPMLILNLSCSQEIAPPEDNKRNYLNIPKSRSEQLNIPKSRSKQLNIPKSQSEQLAPNHAKKTTTLPFMGSKKIDLRKSNQRKRKSGSTKPEFVVLKEGSKSEKIKRKNPKSEHLSRTPPPLINLPKSCHLSDDIQLSSSELLISPKLPPSARKKHHSTDSKVKLSKLKNKTDPLNFRRANTNNHTFL